MSARGGGGCWHAAVVDASQVALDFWVVPLGPERLSAVAAELLADGHDSPALREIAALPRGDAVRERELFADGLRQLGVFIDGPRAARDLQMRRWACQALNGTMARAELVRRVRGLLDFDDLMPGAIRALGIICHGDVDRFDDIVLGRALREVVETLDDESRVM